MVAGCGLGVITVRCGGMMQDAECGATMLCKMWCDGRCGGVMHNVANIWRDLKCGVEYMECGVMWNVM